MKSREERLIRCDAFNVMYKFRSVPPSCVLNDIVLSCTGVEIYFGASIVDSTTVTKSSSETLFVTVDAVASP